MIVKRDLIAISILVAGGLLCLAGHIVTEIGHTKSGVPEFTYAYKMNGRYYYKNRGYFPLADPEQEITQEQYATYVTYQRIGKVPFLLGVFMGMAGGGYIVISKLPAQFRAKRRGRQQAVPRLKEWV